MKIFAKNRKVSRLVPSLHVSVSWKIVANIKLEYNINLHSYDIVKVVLTSYID